MRSKSRKTRDELNIKVESSFRKVKYIIAAKKRLKRMDGGYDNTEEYNEVVVPFWEKYGYVPKKIWFQLYGDREQKMDPRYIPDDLYYGELIPYFSNPQFRRLGEDKCYHDLLFPEIKRPETICKNIAGVYYDGEKNIIEEHEALELCLDYNEEFLIKPSIDSGEGRLIQFFDGETTSAREIASAFRQMRANFIVQAAVKQHEELGKLNPTSLNSVRVVTFLFENQVHVLSCIFRVGAKNSKIDNISAGGFACPIMEDGSLKERAVNRKAQWVEDNGDGVKFSDIKVPYFDSVIETAKKAHEKLAHFKLIGWDFSVDQDGDPVMIEFNSCPGPNQYTCGPTFGDLTEKVLEEFFITRTLEDAQN